MDDLIEIFADLIWKLTVLATAVIFLLKLARWVDWTWWCVSWPFLIWLAFIAGLFVLAGIAKLLDLAFSPRPPKRGQRPQDYDVSHIQPLDSIKNPRRS